jgi:ArsR family transcriptional regulator
MKQNVEMVKEMADVFKALGDLNRLKIINLLGSKTEEKLCVVDLAKKLGITQPAASQHLKVLKGVGILKSKREGFRVYYYINLETLYKFKEYSDKLFKMAFIKCEPDIFDTM